MNPHHNRRLSAEDPVLVDEVSLSYLLVGVWCAASATRIIQPIFSSTTNAHRHVPHILTQFLNSVECERTSFYSLFFVKQDGAAPFTVNNSMRGSETVW